MVNFHDKAENNLNKTGDRRGMSPNSRKNLEKGNKRGMFPNSGKHLALGWKPNNRTARDYSITRIASRNLLKLNILTLSIKRAEWEWLNMAKNGEIMGRYEELNKASPVARCSSSYLAKILPLLALPCPFLFGCSAERFDCLSVIIQLLAFRAEAEKIPLLSPCRFI